MANFDIAQLALDTLFTGNAMLTDDTGMPGVYVRIPKFTLGDVITGAGSATHPAFIVNGVEKDAIYISKYQNIIQNGRAYSLPGQDPAHGLTFDTARAACEAKGSGYHLMTNAEWAALALWCRKNALMPKGNNGYGKDSTETAYIAIPAAVAGGITQHVMTGSGPIEWSHNAAVDGIWDLNGNLAEYVGGVRLNNGEIQILENNNAADPLNSQAAESAQWKAILENGSLVAPGTANTLKYDYASAHGEVAGEYGFQLKKTLAYAQTTEGPYGSNSFAALAGSGVTPPTILKALALMPADSNDHGGDKLLMRNNGERMMKRGGTFTMQSAGGVFCGNIAEARSYGPSYAGFRSAYVAM